MCEWMAESPSAVAVAPAPPPMEVDSTGLVDTDSGEWFLLNQNGIALASFFYGNPGDYPFMGDWDGDGVETPGLYRRSDGYVYLRNSNSQGIADIVDRQPARGELLGIDDHLQLFFTSASNIGVRYAGHTFEARLNIVFGEILEIGR